jgi:hypothetical protein
MFAEPKIPVVDVTGPTDVKIGDAATFNVTVTYDDLPYSSQDIQEVSWLVFDSVGELAGSGKGAADPAGDGLYTVELDAATSAKLAEGSNKLEVIVSSKVVALPTLAEYTFVTAP